jgi:hypothetical protein
LRGAREVLAVDVCKLFKSRKKKLWRAGSHVDEVAEAGGGKVELKRRLKEAAKIRWLRGLASRCGGGVLAYRAPA